MRSMRNFTRFSATLVAVFSVGFLACGDDATPATDTSPDTTDTSGTPDADATPDTTADTTPETTPTNPCDPNPCTVAPGPVCSGDNTGVVTSTAPGACTAAGATASCTYTEATTPCGEAKICTAGACVDAGDPCNYVFGERVSYVTEIKVPATATACCFDFTDDDIVDNKLATILGLVKSFQADFDANALIAEQIADGGLVLLLETKGVTDIANSTGVTLNGFYGADGDADLTNNATGLSSFVVDPSSFATGTEQPLISFSDSVIASSEITAGPSVFNLVIPLLGINLNLAISGTQIEGPVAAGPLGADKGLAMGGEDGIKLGGYVAMTDLANAFNAYLDAECTCLKKTDAAKGYVFVVPSTNNSQTINLNIPASGGASECTEVSEETCSQIGGFAGTINGVAGLLAADVDSNEDGTKESLSIGVFVKATSATVLGVADCAAE